MSCWWWSSLVTVLTAVDAAATGTLHRLLRGEAEAESPVRPSGSLSAFVGFPKLSRPTPMRTAAMSVVAA